MTSCPHHHCPPQHHRRCALLTLFLVISSQESFLAQLSSLTAWFLGGWISQTTPVHLLTHRYSKVLWWVKGTWWSIQDIPDFSGLFTDVRNSFYYFHTLLDLGNPDMVGSTSQVHMAIFVQQSFLLLLGVLLPPQTLPRVLSALVVPTVIRKKARCRASFLRQPPSCKFPHYLVYKFILV